MIPYRRLFAVHFCVSNIWQLMSAMHCFVSTFSSYVNQNFPDLFLYACFISQCLFLPTITYLNLLLHATLAGTFFVSSINISLEITMQNTTNIQTLVFSLQHIKIL